jgi:NAD-dependent dihydropyrimidine dehydrogenase PreA subunit
MTPRVIDQDATHNLCGDCEEVRTICPVDVLLIDETNVGFVDQCGGLQSVTLAFTTHVTAGEAMEFVVNERIQLVEGGLVPFAPFSEQLSDFMLRGSRQFSGHA